VTARPFPWAALDATSHAEIVALRAMRRWSASRFRSDDAVRALETLLSSRVEIFLRRARPMSGAHAQARPIHDGIGAVLALGDGAPLGRGVLIEAEGALAAALIARTLRRAPPSVTTGTPGAGIAGGFAAIVVAVARRASEGLAPRVLAAGPSAVLLADLARVDPELIAVELSVLLDDEAYLARIVLPRATAVMSPPPPWRLDALGAISLRLPIVASVSATSAAELSSLRTGDAWMPGAWPLRRDESGGWTGPVVLAAPSLDSGVSAELGPNERLVLRGDVEPLAWTPSPRVEGTSMNDSSDTEALIEAMGEMPVVVRVEIGSAEMRARDWASLTKGDVIALGTRVGDPVTLRAGNAEIARGELVEIEGEIGVRIVELLQNKESRS
jgi:flagellar motor switch/type III secretory pathway protein FliN